MSRCKLALARCVEVRNHMQNDLDQVSEKSPIIRLANITANSLLLTATAFGISAAASLTDGAVLINDEMTKGHLFHHMTFTALAATSVISFVSAPACLIVPAAIGVLRELFRPENGSGTFAP